MRIRLILVCACFVAAANVSLAQVSSDEAMIKDVVARLFKGMETRDTAAMRAAFSKDVVMFSIGRDKNNEPGLRKDISIAPWLKGVAGQHETYFEETWNLKVQIDGDFAQAWCDYAFYLGNTFHHCGVDAFQLFKSKDGWKIFELADTRRKEPCNIPKAISDKHR